MAIIDRAMVDRELRDELENLLTKPSKRLKEWDHRKVLQYKKVLDIAHEIAFSRNKPFSQEKIKETIQYLKAWY